MTLELLTLILVFAGNTFAVLLAVIAGTISARLFFNASGLDPADAGTGGEKPLT